MKEHTTFFDSSDNENNDTPFYMNTENDEIKEIKEDNFEEDVNDENTVQDEVYINKNNPENTRSNVRNSLLAVVGLVAVIGAGIYSYNKNGQPNNIKNNSAVEANTSAKGAILDLDTGNDREELTGTGQTTEETVDAEVNEETVDAELNEETVDAEVNEEIVDAEVNEEVVEEIVDTDLNDKKELVKVPFIKEESIKMTFVAKTTMFGDTMIDFDSSIIEWEKNGWEAVEAFYHSPTKNGWILKNNDQVVFILQQIVENGENNVLAYIQPKTW